MFKKFNKKSAVKGIIALVLTTILGLMIFTGTSQKAEAAEIRKDENLTVAENEVIREDLYISAETSNEDVVIDGTVHGDVFAAADNVYINGTVAGYLYAAGSTVKINGTVAKSAFIGGNKVVIDGKVGENAYVGAYELTNSGSVAGDIFAGASEVDITGSVGDDIRIGANDLTISGAVLGDLLVGANTVDIDPNKISGDIEIAAGVYNDEVADFVTKETDLFKAENWDEFGNDIVQGFEEAAAAFSAFILTFRIIWFISLTLVGLLILKFAPVKSNKINNRILESPENFLKNLGIGVLAIIALFILIVISIPSMIGIALFPLVLGFLIFFNLYVEIWVDRAAGNLLLNLFNKKKASPYLDLLVGRGIRIALLIIGFIPVVGWLITSVYNFAATMAVLGAMVSIKLDYLKKDSKK